MSYSLPCFSYLATLDILLSSSTNTTLGGFFFKKCTSSGDIKGIIFSPFLYLGGATYLVSAILNIIVLRYLPYSIVLPLTSLTYIWSLILSYLLLNEKITKVKIIGIILILLGAVVLGI